MIKIGKDGTIRDVRGSGFKFKQSRIDKLREEL